MCKLRRELGRIEGTITDGKFKDNHFELEIGYTIADTKLFINGKQMDHLTRKIEIISDADKHIPNVIFHMISVDDADMEQGTQ